MSYGGVNSAVATPGGKELLSMEHTVQILEDVGQILTIAGRCTKL